MSERQLGHVLLTALGLYLVLESLVYLVGFAGMFESDIPIGTIFTTTVVPLAVVGGLGLLLLVSRRRLCVRFFSDVPASFPPGAADLVVALVAVIGVYFAATGLQSVIVTEAQRFISSAAFTGESSGSLFDTFSPDQLARERLRGFSRLSIGVALFLGTRGIAHLWQQLRSAGGSQ